MKLTKTGSSGPKKLIVSMFSCLAKLLECQLAMQARMILITIQILAGVMVVIKNCILKSFKKRMSVKMNQMKGNLTLTHTLVQLPTVEWGKLGCWCELGHIYSNLTLNCV
jgi:hypothetical protein